MKHTPVKVRRVDECRTLHELITHCFPAFGGAFLRRVYTILDRAIGAGCPLTLAIAGPVTVSGQHQAWLIPLLETGWIAYLSTTDAVCYHDGHRSLNAHRDPVFEVPIWGDDGALRHERTIRVTDMDGALVTQRAVVAPDGDFEHWIAMGVEAAVTVVVADGVGGAEIRDPAGFKQWNQPRL